MRAGTSYSTTTITFGGDTIDAGAGKDIVFGDAGRIIMPQSSVLQSNGGTLQAAALAFHAQLQDLQTAIADMAFIAHEVTHGLINELQPRPASSACGLCASRQHDHLEDAAVERTELVMGDDSIVGEASESDCWRLASS